MKTMKKSLVFVVGFYLMANVPSIAGEAFGDPDGGWAYTYDASVLPVDDNWEHDNGSDAWDESPLGEGAPGGVSLLDDGGTKFVRMQDTGDPRDYFVEIEEDFPDFTPVDGDPSNRKIFFDRDIIEMDGFSEEYLNEGFTFSFRARLATAKTGPIDPWFPDGGFGVDDWPETGLGYPIAFNSTTNFSFYQPFGAGALGFALVAPDDPDVDVDSYGLLLNDLNGDLIGNGNGDTGRGEMNLFAVDDLTDWHEFWITVKEGGEEGTHVVNVYADGSTEATTFEVTAGDRADGGDPLTQGPMSIGLPGTAFAGAFDLDFISIAAGVIEPSGVNKVAGDFNNNGARDVDDLDLLAAAMKSGDVSFDLTGDGKVDLADRVFWVENLSNTYMGDSNFDGEFNSADFVAVFVPAKYETGQPAKWAEGDWNGDGVFNSGDFVTAFSGAGYEKGPREGGLQVVPEPSAAVLALLGFVALLSGRRFNTAA